jgi:hypothetical protein
MTEQPKGAVTMPEKVKTARSPKPGNHGLRGTPKLHRQTFRTSREMDFFSQKELVTQTGHDPSEWPLVFLKEIIDNSLDACDEHDIPPRVEVQADAEGISVRDNGPGLPEATLEAALDFKVRASNREAYPAPDRGAQGNALKTILPMPSVLDPGGSVTVESHGTRHTIRFHIDEISQRPTIDHGREATDTSGTRVRIQWPAREKDGMPVWPFPRACLHLPTDGRFIKKRSLLPYLCRELCIGFAMFNPHLSLSLDWFGDVCHWEATDPAWRKWRPCWPTSPHWYELRHLRRLIAAYITHDRDHGEDRLVSQFVAEFDGLTGSAKRTQVLEACGLKRARLSCFVVDGRLDDAGVAKLLAVMQAHSRPVKSRRLGIIGPHHFMARFKQLGIVAESFGYQKMLAKDGLPQVLETVFAYRGDNAVNERLIYSGANWSAAIKNPFQSFGTSGEGLEAALNQQRVGRAEPVIFAIHAAQPRIEYTDRGKSALVVHADAYDQDGDDE